MARLRLTGWLLGLVVGLVMLAAAIVYHQIMAGRIAERVANGQAVTAAVVEIWLPARGPDRMAVRYTIDDDTRQATLATLDPGPGGFFDLRPRYVAGDWIVVYVDPENPAMVATADGYASEPWWLLLPPLPVGGLGAAIACVALASPVRSWWQSRRRRVGAAPTPELTITMVVGEDAAPDWPDAYDRLSSQVVTERVRGESPVRLEVTYMVESAGVNPGFSGIRVERYSRERRMLKVEVALPKHPIGDSYHELHSMLRAAVEEAEQYVTAKRIADGLPKLRRLLDRLPASDGNAESTQTRAPLTTGAATLDRPHASDNTSGSTQTRTPTSAGVVTFDRVRRGYDWQDVDAFLRWFDRAVTSNDPHEWQRAATALRLTSFSKRFKGYDPAQVDDHLTTLAARLRRRGQ